MATHQTSSELGLSAGAGGLVQASAVLMMAAGSFSGSAMGAQFGRERALVAAVGLVALGSVVRGVPALAPLIGGSLLVGFGIGVAGVLLAAWSVAQIPAALLAPALAERRRRWTFFSGLALACGVAGTLGALLVPMPPLVGPWPWVVLIGLGAGAGFPLGLAVIAWRTPDGAASAATSGLALGVGYTVAGLGPLVMGLLIDATGGYPAAIAVLLAAAAVQAFAIVRIGDRPPHSGEDRSAL